MLSSYLRVNKQGIPKIIESIDQTLYPPGFSKEEFSQKNVIGNVFLRPCPYQEQFQIGNLRKEFSKPELLIADNLYGEPLITTSRLNSSRP